MITVLGSLAFDRIMDFGGRFKDHILPEKIHAISVSFLIDALTERLGGTAGNISYNLALLGERGRILANAGNDFAKYAEWIKEQGMDDSLVKIHDDLPTASAMIMNDQDNNQITAFYPGAFSKPIDFDAITFEESDIVVVAPALKEHMLALAEKAAREGAKVVAAFGQNMTQFDEDDIHQFLSQVSVVIANDHESAYIEKAISGTVPEMFPDLELFVTTKGIEGSEIITPEQQFSVAAVEVGDAPDPTGAGDAYTAGFVKALQAGRKPEECAQLASVVASFAVECVGTQEHRFTDEDLQTRFEGTYGGQLFSLN